MCAISLLLNGCICGSLFACGLLLGAGILEWVLDQKLWVISIVDNVLNDFSSGCTRELMRDLNGT